MCVQTAKAAKATLGDAEAFQIGENNLLGATDNNPLDLTLAIHKNTDLAPDLPRYFRESAREVLRNKLSRRQPTLVQLLELLSLPGLQPRNIPFEFMNRQQPPATQLYQDQRIPSKYGSGFTRRSPKGEEGRRRASYSDSLPDTTSLSSLARAERWFGSLLRVLR